jgi:predicted SAM-dependent methyltransferase
VKLHLGSGPRLLEGFVNVDELDLHSDNYIRWDLRKGLPPHLSSEIDVIYSEHFWEHLTWEDGLELMKDCRAALRDGGLFRLALPNFRTMVSHYLANDWDHFDLPGVIDFAPDRQMMQIVNFGCYQYVDGENEHKCMWDPEYAIFTMQQAGFVDCQQVEFDPAFDSPEEFRRRYTFYCEARK